MKDPQFWIGDFTNRIYMTHAWRENKDHPGIFECTGKKFDVTEAVVAIAAKLQLESKPEVRANQEDFGMMNGTKECDLQ